MQQEVIYKSNQRHYVESDSNLSYTVMNDLNYYYRQVCC